MVDWVRRGIFNLNSRFNYADDHYMFNIHALAQNKGSPGKL